MPYREPYEELYSKAIQNTLIQCGFESIRADKIQRSTPFSSDIEVHIRSADLVIAEVSSSNLNVYYELGLAKALNKEVIVLTHDTTSIPSDTKHIRHLVYDVADFEKLKSQFKEWIEKSRAYQFKSQKQTSKVLNRGEIFQEITDATFYLTRQHTDDRHDINKRIQNGSLIPPQYLYKFDRGSALWLELCQDAEYKYFVNSIDFFKKNLDDILNVIGEEIIVNSPDYVSLGPGNGAKDRMFLSKLVERQKIKNVDVYYYPFDISPTLLSDAIRNVVKTKSISDAIKIKAVVCDFSSTLKSFSPVYQFRPEPNIFTLLGNTLGNMDADVGFLHQVKEAMFPGDILIIEVRAISNQQADIGGSMDTNKKFDFTPLDVLGVEYNENNLEYSTHTNRSQVPETRTTIASYHDFSLPGDDMILRKAYLSYIHEYRPENLETAIINTGLHVLKAYNVEGLSCYVLKKPQTV